METLRESVRDYTDEQLWDAVNRRGEYTDEAVKIFEEECARRDIDPCVGLRVAGSGSRDPAEIAAAIADETVKNLTNDDFAPLPHPFTKADALIANAILLDSKVPFFFDGLDSEKVLCCAPVYREAYMRAAALPSDATVPLFAAFVYKDAFDQARELIEEHFAPGGDGCYASRLSGAADRLKAFCFSDIKMSDSAAREPFDVEFSDQEKSSLVKLAKLLLDEADAIEAGQNRILFFYDGLESLIGKLTKGKQLTRVDFLAIIELCQIYCEDERYDAELNRTAESLLSFFLE